MLARCAAPSLTDDDVGLLPEHRPLEVPRIDAIADAADRPFWSVMVPTYNRPAFLEQTLRSILRQAPDRCRMQIEVVDNCSSVGDIENLVKRVGGGRVEYFRQPSNLGHFMNGLTCLRRSRGHWIHILHDDDLVQPGFYANYERLIAQYPDATLLIGPSVHVDADLKPLHISQVLAKEEGPVPDFPAQQAIWNQVSTPTAVVPRRVYEQLGGFPRGLSWASDWELWSRAGSAGRVITTVRPWALYRMHLSSDTMGILASETNVTESMRIIDMLCQRLAPDQRKKLPSNRYRRLAISAVYYAQLLGRAGKYTAAARQLLWAPRLDLNPKTYAWIAGRWLTRKKQARECRAQLEAFLKNWNEPVLA